MNYYNMISPPLTYLKPGEWCLFRPGCLMYHEKVFCKGTLAQCEDEISRLPNGDYVLWLDGNNFEQVWREKGKTFRGRVYKLLRFEPGSYSMAQDPPTHLLTGSGEEMKTACDNLPDGFYRIEGAKGACPLRKHHGTLYPRYWNDILEWCHTGNYDYQCDEHKQDNDEADRKLREMIEKPVDVDLLHDRDGRDATGVALSIDALPIAEDEKLVLWAIRSQRLSSNPDKVPLGEEVYRNLIAGSKTLP